MSYSVDELWRLVNEAYDLPFGPAQIALAEQIIKHSDASGDDELRFAARILGTTAYTYGGEPAKAFVTFSWCLGEYDRDPGSRTRNDERLLLWHFKYMVNSLPSFPEVPLGRTYAVVDDMERRYRTGGHSLHAVYRQRWGIAHHLGDLSAAAGWYEKWLAAPRDENSDCIGCDPSARVTHLVAHGRDEEAVELAEPVLSRQLTCTEQPQGILTRLLLPYLRTGRVEQAADAHRRAYRVVRGNLADLDDIAEHILFCARTGNHSRGLEIIERHLGWLYRAPSPWAAMRFAAASARVLAALADEGHTDLVVRQPVGDVPIAQLADQLATRARELGARFDTRNGTPHQGALVAEILAAERLVDYLPLSAVDQRRRSLAASPAAPVAAPVELPDDPAAVLDLGERLFREHRNDRAEELWRRFDERYPADTLSPLLAARRADARGLLATAADLHADAEAAWREAADGYAAAGDEVRRQVTRSRLGTLLCGTDRYDQGLPMVEEATAYLVEHGEPERRVGAELRLAHALGLGLRPMAALEAVERAIAQTASAAGGVDPLLDAEVAMRQAQFLLTLGRVEEAAAAATRARDRFAAAGDPPAAALAFLLYAHALADLGDHAGAADAFGAALDRSTEPDVVLSAQLGRGRAHLAGGEPGRAVEPLVEAVAGFVAEGNDSAATFARFDLAAAFHASGRSLDAAEAAEEALPELERLGAQDAADRCRYLLSLVYRALDQPDEALALLDTLVQNLDGYDNLAGRAQMHEEAGHILYRQDHDATAAGRFAAAADGYRDAGLTLDEVRARRWTALAQRFAGDLDTALVTLVTAEERAAALEVDGAATTWEKAMLAFDGARVLIGADRMDEALTRASVAGNGFRSIGAFGEAIQADLLHAELLFRLDRPGEAEPVLRAALGAAPRESAARENSAWLLSEVLDALGRHDEADEIRKEYGLDED
jgi:tetratricopeptide (TPR) repeat protein